MAPSTRNCPNCILTTSQSVSRQKSPDYRKPTNHKALRQLQKAAIPPGLVFSRRNGLLLQHFIRETTLAAEAHRLRRRRRDRQERRQIAVQEALHDGHIPGVCSPV